MSTDPARKIRIGTIVPARNAPSYIQQIARHGFESYSITFGRMVGGVDLAKLADEVKGVLGEAVISSVGVYGNPLEEQPEDLQTLRSWEALIDNVHLFGADIVAGFTGRLRGKPVEESLPRFKQIFEPLARRAEDKGVRIAFENCEMGGTWRSGDWNIALTPEVWGKMFDAVPSDNIGLEWEPCHQMVKLIDPMPQLRTWVKRMFHIHGKDATIKWDVVRSFGIQGSKPFAFHRTPGFGDSNWTDIISDLRMGGFEGSIDIEGWHDPVYRKELEMTGQVHALNYLKRCRGGDFVANPS